MMDWYIFLIAVVVIALQWILSSMDYRYLGAVIPVTYLAGLCYMQIAGIVDWSFLQLVLIITIGELFLYGEWSSGRKALKAKKEKELTKMKVHDM